MDQPKRRLIISIAMLFSFLCLFAGMERDLCASTHGPDLDGIAYVAGDMLEGNLLYDLDRTLPIISTSFVNLDDLNETSAFGRLIGEQIASRLSQHGYKVVDLRLSNGKVLVKEKNGELALSREMKRINKSHDAQAVIVGTYCIAENWAFVSTRLVSTLDNSILSSYNFSIRMGGLLRALVKKNISNADKSKKTVEISDINPEKTKGAGNDPISIGSMLLDLTTPLSAKIVQSQLARLGYYTAKIDGKWGKQSHTALASFKRVRGLPNVNEWNMRTQIALFSG
jgi:TolB-like protein